MTPVLLRLCLILMLALNGAGAAFAWAPMDHARAEAAADAAATEDCHTHAGAEAPAPMPDRDAPCGPDGCDCLCAQHAPGMIALAATLLPAWPIPPPRASLHAPHRAPPSTQPIRPPIA